MKRKRTGNYHPKRCHTGEVYGAIVVRDMHKITSNTAITYDVHWSCCDRDATLTQQQLNGCRTQMPGQCAECRRAGKPVSISIRDYVSPGQRAKMKDWIETPWGMLQTIDGWSNESRISRPWAFD